MIKILNKRFKPRIKARIRKNRQVLAKNFDNFFEWVKGAKLVELKKCDPDEDPVFVFTKEDLKQLVENLS